MTLDSDVGLPERDMALGIGASTIPVNQFVVDRTPPYPVYGVGSLRADLIPFEDEEDPFDQGLNVGFKQGVLCGRREMTRELQAAREAAYHAGLEDGRAEEHSSPWLEVTISAAIVVVAILAFIALVSQ